MKDQHIKKVLIVDDEVAYISLIERYLEKQGYVCSTAPNAAIALEEFSRAKFDLMISDIVMSGTDGLELTRQALQLQPDLACIMMTGHTSAYPFSDIIACGADDFIRKPFEITELQAKIERINRERLIRHQLSQTNAALSREVAINIAISELSNKFMIPLPIGDISKSLLHELLQLTGSRNGFMVLTNRDAEDLEFSLCENLDGTDQHPCWDDCLALQQYCRSALGNPYPRVTNSPAPTATIQTVPNSPYQVTRMLSVPVVVNGAVCGQVAVANAPKDYTDKELSTAKRLAMVFELGLERRQVNEDLKKTKEYLEFVFDNASEAICIVDAQGLPMKWNKAAVELFGYTMEELRGKSIFQLYASSAQLEHLLGQLRRDGFVKRYEVDILKKNGQIIPAELSIALLKNRRGRVLGSVTVGLDLTDIKEAMARIQQINVDLEAEIERRKAIEEELMTARTELEKLVEERTAKLSEAGELIKRSITVIKDVGGL